MANSQRASQKAFSFRKNTFSSTVLAVANCTDIVIAHVQNVQLMAHGVLDGTLNWVFLLILSNWMDGEGQGKGILALQLIPQF